MKKKTIALFLALALVVGCAIGGTVAWLTASTTPVVNTFTVGDINITLTETFNTDTNNDGTNDKWTGKIVPGGEQVKDPKITVAQGSEKCYVYAKVTNNLVINGTTVVTPDINTTNWIKVGTNGNTTLYRYKDIVDATTAAQTLAVFTKVSYAGSITKDNISTLNNKTIEIQAYAYQSENVKQAAADTAANTWAGTTAIPAT